MDLFAQICSGASEALTLPAGTRLGSRAASPGSAGRLQMGAEVLNQHYPASISSSRKFS